LLFVALKHDKTDQLFVAAKRGDTAAIKRLIADGIDINAQTELGPGSESGYTALHFAVVAGKADAVDLLIALGANIHIKAQGDRTLLLALVESGPAGQEAMIQKLTQLPQLFL